MQFSTLVFIAVAATGAMAAGTYEIKLYSNGGCHLWNGLKCGDLKANQCCFSADKQFKSGKISDGASKLTKLTLWGDACSTVSLGSGVNDGCVAASSQNVMGASVIDGSKLRRDEASQPPPEPVEADAYFLDEGDYSYTIKRNSSAGQALELITRREEISRHFRRFGARELLNGNTNGME